MIQSELEKNKKQTNWIRWYILFNSIVILVFFISAFREPVQKFRILRARGIVLEDSTCRDSILIGLPVPFSKFREGTVTNMERKYWANNFGNVSQYIQWYQEYNNSAEGMVVMDENSKSGSVIEVDDSRGEGYAPLLWVMEQKVW